MEKENLELLEELRAKAATLLDTSNVDELKEETDPESKKESIPVESIDISKIFEGEELTEEFKTKVTALFEAAVSQRANAIEEAYAQALADIKAEQDQKSLTESEELVEGLTEKVDGYLDYVVEQWISDNEIALERGIKADLFDSFMNGMKTLFVEHHINVPEQEMEVLDELQSVNEELEEKLDSILAENVELKKVLKDIEKQHSIMEATEGLSDMDAERFVELAEDLSYDNEESFGKKLAVIRENFFQQKSTSQKQLVESVVTDTPVLIEEETADKKDPVDPSINAYVSELSRINT